MFIYLFGFYVYNIIIIIYIIYMYVCIYWQKCNGSAFIRSIIICIIIYNLYNYDYYDNKF